jgi:hypothetical protein
MNESVESDALVIPSSSGRPDDRRWRSRTRSLHLRAGSPAPHPAQSLAGTPSPRSAATREPEAVDLLLDQELGVADILDLHPPHHLPDDDLDVLAVEGDALHAVDLLDLVDEIGVQRLLTEARLIICLANGMRSAARPRSRAPGSTTSRTLLRERPPAIPSASPPPRAPANPLSPGTFHPLAPVRGSQAGKRCAGVPSSPPGAGSNLPSTVKIVALPTRSRRLPQATSEWFRRGTRL